MKNQELIVQIIIISAFILWAYSRVKRQSIKDTFEDIKEFIQGLINKDG
jgi:C4-dicarboxylate transporter